MQPAPRFTVLTFLCLLLVLSCAFGVRIWYLAACVDYGRSKPALQVQGDYPRRSPENKTDRARLAPTELQNLVENIVENNGWFGCWTPLSDKEEATAHLAPGYPLLCGGVVLVQKDSADMAMRWLQCVLGSLTVGCYFFFARRAFHSTSIATLVGLVASFYPFWVINTAELNDGVLTGFLLGLVLMFGTRSSQTGGAFSGLVFGIALALLCQVRAIMLPFAIMALLWFLWRCRRFSLGWFAAILTLLGFVNTLAPWGVRNYHEFHRPVPIVTSTYLHLWMGNNPLATGSTLDEKTLRQTLPPERLKELLEIDNQARRYDKLAYEVSKDIREEPTKTMSRRFTAGLMFLFGADWFKQNRLVITQEGEQVAAMPEALKARANNILTAVLLGLFPLAFLGWRWSQPWRVQARLGTLATLWIPLPYILSHAEVLSGPRLPYDGLLLCYAAFALARLIPGVVGSPEPPPPAVALAVPLQ